MTTNKELALMPSAGEWQTMFEMATALVKSGFLPSSIKTPEAAVAIILTGREIGIPMMQAFRSVHVINGRPTLSAELMAALVLSAGHTLDVLVTSDTECQVAVRRRNSSHTYTQKTTWEDAKRADVTTKDTWKKYPAAMLRARAISAACRVVFPDIISGMYTPEEMGAEIELDKDGHEVVIEQVNSTTGEISSPPPTNNNHNSNDRGKYLPVATNHFGQQYEEYKWELGQAQTLEAVENISGRISRSGLPTNQLEMLRVHRAEAKKRIKAANEPTEPAQDFNEAQIAAVEIFGGNPK